MPNQTNLQGGSSPVIAKDGTPLDPTAAALTRAIRQVESGAKYDATGASGERGAYQWMPGNFEATAKQFGLDPTDFSPVNQDKVAYHAIEAQIKAGRSQSEVASWWNSGKYDSTGRVGTNKQGVHFDTPAYVEKVKQAYIEHLRGLPGASENSSSVATNLPGVPNLPQPATLEMDGMDTGMSGSTQAVLGAKQGEGFLGGLYNSVVSPLAGLAATPLQAGVAGYNALTGSNIQDPFAEGIPSITGTNTPITPLDLEKKLGDVAQVGSYFVPGGGLASAAGAGALQGGGMAMSRGEDLPTVAVSTGLGAGLNVGGTLATKAVGGLINKAGGAISGEGTHKAAEGIKNAYGSALNLSAGERAYENRSGNDLARVLMDNAAPLSRYDDGTLDASKAIPILKKKLLPLDNEAAVILDNAGNKRVNLLDVASAAKKSITQKATTAFDRRSANKAIDQYITQEISERAENLARETYGLTVNQLAKQQKAKVLFDAANPLVVEADRIKTGFWNATFDKTRSDLHNHVPYQIGSGLKEAIEKAVPGSDLNKVNAERGDLIDAIRRLQKMDGVKLLKGGRLGNMASGLIGAMAGTASGLGPLGALGGDYFGQKAAQFLQDPATKIAIAQGKAKASGLIPSLMGGVAEPVGKGISAVGKGISKSSRAVGLMAGLLPK